MPLTGHNRTLVWHGLRRLAKTRKEGLASLLRFFRLKGETVTVRQATWQISPLLNAAGRLRILERAAGEEVNPEKPDCDTCCAKKADDKAFAPNHVALAVATPPSTGTLVRGIQR